MNTDPFERIIDSLASQKGGMSGLAICKMARVEKSQTRKLLLEAEKLGIVYRTGRTRGTLWYLG